MPLVTIVDGARDTSESTGANGQSPGFSVSGKNDVKILVMAVGYEEYDSNLPPPTADSTQIIELTRAAGVQTSNIIELSKATPVQTSETQGGTAVGNTSHGGLYVPKARYVTYSVSGSLQAGYYSFSSDSSVVIDTQTGLEVDADITVLGPGNTSEKFIARPVYNVDRMWQWQGQGSAGGSLDFQDQRNTFVGYSGSAPLTNSAYTTPSLDHIVTSSNTVLKPIGSSDKFPKVAGGPGPGLASPSLRIKSQIQRLARLQIFESGLEQQVPPLHRPSLCDDLFRSG